MLLTFFFFFESDLWPVEACGFTFTYAISVLLTSGVEFLPIQLKHGIFQYLFHVSDSSKWHSTQSEELAAGIHPQLGMQRIYNAP